MPPRKTKSAEKEVTKPRKENAAARPSSKIPPPLRFPLLVALSLTLSSLSYSIAAKYTAAELASVARKLDQWWEVAALLAWRTFELGLAWYGDYDGYDLASLSLLSHGPTLYLLGAFYDIRPTTVVSTLLINILTTYLPFRLLRPLSPAHAVSSSHKAATVANQAIVTDISIQALSVFLAASIYSVVLYTSYVTYLPTYLVTYFSDIPSIAAAYGNTPISLLPLTILLGIASKTFIFTPAAAAAPSRAEARAAAFDPVTASLGETFWYNVWGYSARSKVAIKRTLTAALVSGVNTFVQTFVTIRGVEAAGAIAYSGVWTAAAGTTGAALGLVLAV